MGQVDPGVLAWITESVAPGASVESVIGLRRGNPPWLVTLSHSDLDAVVVRVGDESTVGLLATEAAALEALVGSSVPGPQLLAVAFGDARWPGVFAVATSRVAGTSRLTSEPSPQRLHALGAAAALVHVCEVPNSPLLPVRCRPIEPVDLDAVLATLPDRSLLRKAHNVVRELPVPEHRSVFVHGDFWHGNTMWGDDDQLTGVVDWESAGVGHPGVDLGMLRCDAALTVETDGPAAVLAGYEAVTGDTASDIPYWDTVAAMTTPPTMETFVFTIIGQGRTDLGPERLRIRRDDFLVAALELIG
jgi:aminoglycoside phosphotransferase (APT) family kinase protein